MTNGASPGRAMLVLGGVGGILWLVGAILSVIQHNIVSGVGGIILGIGVIFASFAAIGFWQRTKDIMAILTFVFALVGGVLLLVGGVLTAARVGVAGNVAWTGQALFAVSLIVLGLLINKLGPQLSTQARLGMDLVFPAVATSMAGGCAAIGAAVTVTTPAAVILAVMFFVTK
jgi:hypothetical protein